MKSSKQFFSILIPLSALFITLTLIITQTSLNAKFADANAKRETKMIYNLIQGWNVIAPPLETGLTHRDLCNQFGITEIYHWQNGNGNPYLMLSCANPTTPDTKIEPNLGYLFYLAEAREWEIKGTKVPVKIDFNEAGFYMFNFVQNERKDLFVDEVCNKFASKNNLEAIEIYQMKNNGWDSHICALPSVNNYKLNYGVGYLIQMKDKDKPAKANPKLNLPTN